MWKRRFIFAGLLVVLIVGLFLGWQFYTNLLSDKDLRDAVAEADRLDPGWRLEELEGKRAVIPATENSAEEVAAIKKLIKSWPPRWMIVPPESKPTREDPPLVEQLMDLSPEIQLNPEQTRQLRAELEKMKEPLAKAHALAHYRGGRYPVKWSPDPNRIPMDCQDTRDVTTLLQDDARVRAQGGDVEGALVCVSCILSVARSIGDEPHVISQLVRMANQGVATNTLERILAQGQTSAATLANLQRNFENEASQPLILFGLRGERAHHHRMMEAIESGELKASSLFAISTGPPTGKLEAWSEDIGGQMLFRKCHVPHIRVMTQVVEIAKLPVEEQRSRLKSYLRSIDEDSNMPIQVRLMMPMMGKFGEGSWRNQAYLRCAIVALATERYRLAHGHWPDSVSSLVPEFLAEAPLDPYDAKPLRCRRLEDGVVIYSIGPDEEDNGGKVDREHPIKSGTDLGFQLWDVNKRRQPWRPPAKPKEQEDD
jgi:hypothetical protein